MRIIDADRLKEVFRRNTGHDYSELIDIQPTVDALDKIKEEIEQIEINGYIRDIECFTAGINTALNVINKYRNEVGE